jgi:hypothetical protein
MNTVLGLAGTRIDFEKDASHVMIGSGFPSPRKTIPLFLTLYMHANDCMPRSKHLHVLAQNAKNDLPKKKKNQFLDSLKLLPKKNIIFPNPSRAACVATVPKMVVTPFLTNLNRRISVCPW